MDPKKIDRKLLAVRILAAISVLALLAGCHKQVTAVHPPPLAPQPASEAKTAPPSQSKPVSVYVPNKTAAAMPSEETKATIQSLLNRIQDIYFDYDKHALRPDAESTLQADAKTLREILADYPTYKLTVQGFCDERGSDEYNLALGDARARKAELSRSLRILRLRSCGLLALARSRFAQASRVGRETAARTSRKIRRVREQGPKATRKRPLYTWNRKGCHPCHHLSINTLKRTKPAF